MDRLVSPLGEWLTPESVRRLLALQPDADLQARVDEMATRHTEGQLTPEAQAEYRRYVSYATFIAILKSKARQLPAMPVTAEKNAARDRFERHFGEVNLGRATGADNEGIDADLARAYADNHEEG
jgi:hypothetical protein